MFLKLKHNTFFNFFENFQNIHGKYHSLILYPVHFCECCKKLFRNVNFHHFEDKEMKKDFIDLFFQDYRNLNKKTKDMRFFENSSYTYITLYKLFIFFQEAVINLYRKFQKENISKTRYLNNCR